MPAARPSSSGRWEAQTCVVLDQVSISYVEEEEPLAARRANLVDYGFVCRCERCRSESESESEDLAGQRLGAGSPSPDA